jgi:F-type H+-transporting ATPase subunit b
MQLDWSTFILEIVNFLILVWLLKRFFYRPVMDVIARRREEIQARINQAEKVRSESEALKAEYENRLSGWEQEKAAARQALHQDIESERKQLREELAASIEQEREKERVLNERKLRNEQRNNEKRALEKAHAFVSRLLARLADRELEARIIRVALEDLDQLSAEQQALLKKSASKPGTRPVVTSAYPLSDEDRAAVEKSLSGLLDQTVECEYRSDPDLLAGLHIGVGSWMLQATLKDELKYFREEGRGRR